MSHIYIRLCVGHNPSTLGLNCPVPADIVVGAPWEGDGAVYIFLGSPDGLKEKFSQRLSPENFTPGVRGFGMAISRGIDIDNNGYPGMWIVSCPDSVVVWF